MGLRPKGARIKIVGADIFTSVDARSVTAMKVVIARSAGAPSVILSRRSECDGVSKSLSRALPRESRAANLIAA
jgi:hypothetical protein